MSLGKPTEMALRDLLVEGLKRRGVVVIPETSFRTVDGYGKTHRFDVNKLTKRTPDKKEEGENGK